MNMVTARNEGWQEWAMLEKNRRGSLVRRPLGVAHRADGTTAWCRGARARRGHTPRPLHRRADGRFADAL